MQAVFMGVPTLASDLPPVRELASDGGQSLVPAGDKKAWKRRIGGVLCGQGDFSLFDSSKVLTVKDTCTRTLDIYSKILRQRNSGTTGM
jgi:hypothetical protein